MKALPAFLSSLLVVLSVGCGGDDSSSTADGSMSTSCLFDEPISAPTSWMGIADTSDINMTPENLGDDVPLAAVFSRLGGGGGDPVDLIELDLIDTVGPFSAGIGPMEIDLATQSDPTMPCGACLYILADAASTESGLQIGQMLWVESGTLDLTTASSTVDGMVQGTIDNASMREVDPQTGADVAGGCTTTLPSITLDATLSAPSS